MMTKTESLIKMKEKGAYDALMLRTAASSGELTETEIIDREFAAPTFDNTSESALRQISLWEIFTVRL